MIEIVCWKWGGNTMPKPRVEYTSDHVNRLHSMVRRHLSIPHRFNCITDDPSGISSDVRIIPLWDDLRSLRACYTRLKAFSPDMRRVIGPRFLSIDLDTVIVGSLDRIVDRPEDFVIWRSTERHTPYCGSMFLMTAGSRSQVWESFNPSRSIDEIRRHRYIGSDQAWISICLPNEATWGKSDGVMSFRRQFRSPNALPGRALRQGAYCGDPPASARIIFFHGVDDPSQTILQRKYPWIVKHWR